MHRSSGGPTAAPPAPALAALAAMAALLAACPPPGGDDDDTATATPTEGGTPTEAPAAVCAAGQPIEVSGAVDEDTTWDCTAAPYRVTGDVSVKESATLTIGAGVTVEFDSQAALLVGTGGPGAILADGTDAPITFTSADGVPGAGDWEAVVVDGGATAATFRGVHFEYGGDYTSDFSGGASALLVVSGAEATIEGCTFRHSGGAAIAFMDGGSAASFVDNTFGDNGEESISIGAGEVGSLSGAHTFEDGADRVQILGGPVTASATWADLGVPYHVLDDIQVGGSSLVELTLAPGTTFLFDSETTLLIGSTGQASILADGADGAITFGSAKPVPAAESWEAVVVDAGAAAATFNACTFRHGGNYTSNGSAGGDAALLIIGAEATVTGCTFEDNGGYGVAFLEGASAAAFHDNSFSGSDVAGVLIGAAELATLSAPNTFETGDVIRVDGGTVTATGTWAAAGAPYQLLDDVHVGGEADPQITLAPGTTFLMSHEVALIVGGVGPGGIVADATDAPITFSSAEAVPAAGDWEAVVVDFGATAATFVGVRFEYGGNYTSNASAGLEAGLGVIGVQATVTGCTFFENSGTHLSFADSASAAGFHDNTFSGGATTAVVMGAREAASLSAGNTFDAAHRIRLLGGTVVETGTWSDVGAPYTVEDDVHVGGASAPILTLSPGVTLEFESEVAFIVGGAGQGALVADGSTATITFTSAESVKAAGDWEALIFDAGTVSAQTQLIGLDVGYCGNYTSNASVGVEGCVGIIGVGLTIADSHIHDSESAGIDLKSGAGLTVPGTTFADIAGVNITGAL